VGETNNDPCLTMKWFERIAQGFNPGSASRVMCPESGTRRGTGLARRYRTSLRTPVGRHFSSFVPVALQTMTDRQGVSSITRNPGVKPWAVLCDHFMVKAFPVVNERVSSPTVNREDFLLGTSVNFSSESHVNQKNRKSSRL